MALLTKRGAAFSFAVLICACLASAQDAPSLGDVARQTRQKKQSKDSQNSGNTPRVITNEDMPKQAQPSASSASERDSSAPTTSTESGTAQQDAEQWKAEILEQKSLISRLQSDIEKLNDSIQFAPGNCVAGCVEWNQQQQQKQREVERMRAQLEDQKARLQQMQDAARRQGYGSSVYDP